MSLRKDSLSGTRCLPCQHVAAREAGKSYQADGKVLLTYARTPKRPPRSAQPIPEFCGLE